MPQLTTFLMALVPLAIAGGLIWLYLTKFAGAENGRKKEERAAYQGVVKKDWVATGRIDFATREEAGGADAETPAEFRLLVEERRIVESIAGNENLEIQWRLASLKEAKVVIAQYHQYLADHELIRSVAEPVASAAPAAAASAAPAATAAPAMAQETPATAAMPPNASESASRPESEPPIRMVASSDT